MKMRLDKGLKTLGAMKMMFNFKRVSLDETRKLCERVIVPTRVFLPTVMGNTP